MIFITGDTHAEWMHRLNNENFPEQLGKNDEKRPLTKDDYVIILGDFGIWDNSLREKFNLDWLEKKPFTTLFVSGNHENYDILDSLPVEEWHGGKVNFIRPSVIHLRRGQVFEIDGRKFFTFGGASSHDISAGILEPDDPDFKKKKRKLNKDPYALYRINHVSWWKQELPTEEEMEEGLKNLEKHNYEVDYILTHCPYTSLLERLDGGAKLYEKDYLTDYLQEIKDSVYYEHLWLFGHMHVNFLFADERAVCLYEQITRLC